MQSENEIGARWFLILLLVFVLGCAIAYRSGFKAGQSRAFLDRQAMTADIFSCPIPTLPARQQACDAFFDQAGDILSQERQNDASAQEPARSGFDRY